MSGIDLDRPIGAEVEETLDDIPFDGPYVEGESVPEAEKSGLSFDLGFLKARTGTGSIEERVSHPMNFNRSKGVAQIIRGLEGLFGSLDLAIIDIVMGFVEVIKERRGVVAS